MTYLYIKSIHLIFVVSWFAGLFYNVRLFIYWTEAQEKTGEAKIAVTQQLGVMSAKLWHIITWPASVITLLSGLYLIHDRYSTIIPFWLWVKLGLLVGLFVYQIYSYKVHRQMMQGVFKMSSTQLRLYNEIATLFLFAIIFLVVLKNTANMFYGVIGLFVLAIVLMLAVQLYKKLREK